jgi:hypothetical protein
MYDMCTKLMDLPFWRSSVAEKLKMIEDGRPFPLLPEVKGIHKGTRRVEFHFKWPKYVRQEF